MVALIGIESLLDSPSSDLECLAPSRRFDRLEVESVDGAGAYESFDFGENLRFEDFSEAPFFSADPSALVSTLSWVLQSPSLTSTSSEVSLRKRRYSAICSKVCSTASGGMIIVTVLPSTFRVSDQLGPWPGSPSREQ
jgi:hypothetical protein